MKILIQRVARAQVDIAGKEIAAIGRGLLVFVGFSSGDKSSDYQKIISKILALRLWSSADNGFDLSISQIAGEVLLVSQFTLLGDCSRGNRPDFSKAMVVDKAREEYDVFIDMFKKNFPATKTGVFQGKMMVGLENDGPVSIILDF